MSKSNKLTETNMTKHDEKHTKSHPTLRAPPRGAGGELRGAEVRRGAGPRAGLRGHRSAWLRRRPPGSPAQRNGSINGAQKCL